MHPSGCSALENCLAARNIICFASRPNLLPLQFKNASINGICVGSVEHFEHLNKFLSAHLIHPVIDKTFAFEDAPAAYGYLKSSAHFGKVVIDVGGSSDT